jgi:hypothetical protein
MMPYCRCDVSYLVVSISDCRCNSPGGLGPIPASADTEVLNTVDRSRPNGLNKLKKLTFTIRPDRLSGILKTIINYTAVKTK